jgi:hypothetical protein
MHTGRGWFRLAVAAHHILQPIVRLWGRHRTVLNGQHRLSPAEIELTGPMTVQRGGVLLLPEAAPRPTIAASIVDALRRAGIRVAPGSEWDDHDARLVGSSLLIGRLVTSSHPEGSVQVRVRRRLIPHRAAITGVVAGGALLLGPAFGLAVGSAVGIDLSMGWWRTGPLVRRTVERATQ